MTENRRVSARQHADALIALVNELVDENERLRERLERWDQMLKDCDTLVRNNDALRERLARVAALPEKWKEGAAVGFLLPLSTQHQHIYDSAQHRCAYELTEALRESAQPKPAATWYAPPSLDGMFSNDLLNARPGEVKP